MSAGGSVDVVVPTAGRDSLRGLLDALAREGVPKRLAGRLIVVDDRRFSAGALPGLPPGAAVIPGPARGPAAARNAGWRESSAAWVAFLDDDVVPTPGWAAALLSDLSRAGPDVAGNQGRVEVPLPEDRRPTDWERNVAGLERAQWATADMAYRREALSAVGGFDERFARAYREDSDLALRVMDAGWRLERGERRVLHPVRAASAWVSVRLQAGNADDVLMRRLHGRAWRARVGAPRGRLPAHLATVGVGLAGAVAAVAGRRRLALVSGLGWGAATVQFAWRRIAPGPRTATEVGKMLATSVAIPPTATWHFLRGYLTRGRRLADSQPGSERKLWRTPRGADAPAPARRAETSPPRARRPGAVLLDRDGTLIVDVPYNGDPAHVEPVPGARAALDRLRAAGLPLGVVSNQSGVARGLIDPEDVARVNRRVEELLGPLGPWAVCPHGPEDGCGCRKPAPGLILAAASRLGVAPERCAVIGDIGADVEAARAAGARGVLVPTPRTRPEEVAAAPEVAPDLPSAVELLVGEAA